MILPEYIRIEMRKSKNSNDENNRLEKVNENLESAETNEVAKK